MCSHVYALAPGGALKWIASGAGNRGVAVGTDGTVYVASEDFIKAFNPNGAPKWTFEQNPRAFICLGVSVGPDENIYSVGTQGMGVFSLTPQGTLRFCARAKSSVDREVIVEARVPTLCIYARRLIQAPLQRYCALWHLGGVAKW